MLRGFVDGLTGAAVAALWDGDHCSCEPGMQKNLWGYAESLFLCGV